ncbi:hypothetical protein GFY24_36660 [Nocardia sp. SYP-A9097]|uniref:hypothetical protein n=1 Tax=Nocardia sp. SYP-A9097 TaxID=2663237 RepID=UPI00129A82B2|nr:hypothetical protein [Nocardia sp. SYP-A9097]MRH92889.1 hypothetical protein [Nocardia sp. SYP-A9097]
MPPKYIAGQWHPTNGRTAPRSAHASVGPRSTPCWIKKILRTNKLSTVWHSIVKDTELSWSTLKTLRSTRATRVAEAHGIPAARLILGHEENSAITTQAYVNLERPVVDYADTQ